MPSLTLKDLPPRLHSALKKRAVRNRRSLNQEALYCLERATGLVRETDDVRAEWLDASAKSLARTWENKEDDVYNELLEKSRSGVPAA
jgi:plasmid stability protein